jgi:DNA-binding response OmpR family regulator
MDLNTITNSRSPVILITERDPFMLEMLPDALHQRMPAVKLEVCSSRDHGMEKLITSRYKLVISNVHIAELDDFLFLKRSRLLQRGAPLVITGGQVESASIRYALEQGAFDHISSPLDLEQTVHTVQLALWYSQIQHLIASHNYALERYCTHMITSPDDKQLGNILKQGLVAVDKSFDAVEETVMRMRRSLEDIGHIAIDVENEVRQQAIGRLDALLKTRGSAPFGDDPFPGTLPR